MQVLGDRFPYHFDINAEILVYQLISHAADFLPRDARILLFGGFGNVARGLADYFRFPDDGILNKIVIFEIVKRRATSVTANFINRFVNPVTTRFRP